MKEKTLATASVLAAVMASLCCIGPLVAVGLGLGAFGAATVFELWRPYLLAATAVLLAGAFYLLYRRQPQEQCDGEACTVADQKSKKILLWVVAVTVVGLAAFPHYSDIIWGGVVTASASTDGRLAATDENGFAGRIDADGAPKLENVVYAVEGMTCPSCAFGIQATLSRRDGIEQIEVLYDDETAHVAYDPTQITGEQLSAAFAELGYKVSAKSGS